ncbi:MAG: S8 family serine peptidase [Solirubrobacterales bacterium]|nr:S8 family serine peptidase [Solirubrobacterales bacterium]
MPFNRLRPLLLSAAIVVASSGTAAQSSASAGEPAYRPGEVIVRYAPGVDRTARAATQRATGTEDPEAFAPQSRTLQVSDGQTVTGAIRALRRRPGVLSATPNYLARASAYLPNDPGPAGVPGGWAQLQWNFLSGTGVDAPVAWEQLIAAGRPGGRGVTVAVLDTGLAYNDRGRFRQSPDFSRSRLRRGYDFVAKDPYPNDQNGHGTHVASTIGESTGNGQGLTGLAYGATIMPVRVLDATGVGEIDDIARGIRFAVRNGAKIVNLSFEFDGTLTGGAIPGIIDALRFARSRGVLVIGASGNASARAVAYPARSSLVISVGATTEHGCQADYSNSGSGLDIAAPGGGADAEIAGDPSCRPQEKPGRPIFQLTFDGSVRRFGFPSTYTGTSMASPHVSAVAALVVASGVIGSDPSPGAIAARLKATATDLGTPGIDGRYGAGLLNAARATAPG